MIFVSGEAEFLCNERGERYIDAISGVYNASYGHAHPRLIRVIRKFPRLGILNCYDNPTEERALLEAELGELTGLSDVHLFSTGAEAIEKALSLALQSVEPRRRGVLHFNNGFHGKSMGTIGLFTHDATPYESTILPVPPDEASEDIALTLLREAVSTAYGVVILEPVMSFYGSPFSIRFLRALRQLCTEFEAVLIFDEMVTGFGRAGVNFVANTVRPDLLVTGKGLGQGLPISAVLFDPSGRVNSEIFSWTTATANNAFMCRIGLESCRILKDEDMAQRSERVGERLYESLEQLGVIHRCVWTFRRGSMIFLQIEGTSGSAERLEEELRERKHILTRGHGQYLVLMPPFVTSVNSIDEIAEGLKRCLEH